MVNYLNTFHSESSEEQYFSNFGIGYKLDAFKWVSLRNYLSFGHKTVESSELEITGISGTRKKFLSKACNTTVIGFRLADAKDMLEFFAGPGISVSRISVGGDAKVQDATSGVDFRQKIIQWAYRPSMFIAADLIMIKTNGDSSSEWNTKKAKMNS